MAEIINPHDRFFKNIFSTDKITKEDLQKAIESIPEGGDIMPTIAEQWIEEGYKKGIKQGIQEGIKQGVEQGMQQGIKQGVEQGMQEGMQRGIRQGLLSTIKLGLKLRFGTEGLGLYHRIKQIEDTDVLEAISEAIIMGKDREEIEKICSI